MNTLGSFIASFGYAIREALSYEERTKLALNLIDQHDKDTILKLLNALEDDVPALVINAFNWDETPEGVEYWNAIYWRTRLAKENI